MPTSETEQALIRSWSAGERAAGRALLEPIIPGLKSFFRCKVQRDADVDDLVQRTLITCQQSIGRFRGDSVFKAFVYGIARNMLLKFYDEQRRRRAIALSDNSSAQDFAPDPRYVLEQREDVRLLMKALRRIPMDFQIALELCHWEGMRGAEIAYVLQIPPSTVRTRIHRGMRHLRKKIAELADSEDLLRKTSVSFESWRLGLHDQLPVQHTTEET